MVNDAGLTVLAGIATLTLAAPALLNMIFPEYVSTGVVAANLI